MASFSHTRPERRKPNRDTTRDLLPVDESPVCAGNWTAYVRLSSLTESRGVRLESLTYEKPICR
jgi:hypothetical protein